MSSLSFPGVAFDNWLTSFPETSPQYDEWIEAQDNKKALLKKADDIIESFPSAGLDSYDEIDDIVKRLQTALPELIKIRDEFGALDEDFPEDCEPDGDDQGWDE